MEANGFQRKQEDELSLEDRRKRLQTFLAEEEQGYGRELEARKSSTESHDQKLHELRERVASARENKCLRQQLMRRSGSSVPKTHIPDAETLARELREQMRLKEERIWQLKEEEKEEEKRRRRTREEQILREQEAAQQRSQGREQFGRELWAQGEQARLDRQEKMARDRADQQQSLAENTAAMRISEHTRQQEVSQKKSEAFEDMRRAQDLQQSKRNRLAAEQGQWASSLIAEQPRNNREEVAATKARFRDEQLRFLEEQRLNRVRQAAMEAQECHLRELEGQEVDRVQAQRQGALQAAQRRLGDQVYNHRNQQIQEKELVRQREDKERVEQVELSQQQMEQWKLEEEEKRKAVREQQLAYSQQLKEQIQYKNSRNNF